MKILKEYNALYESSSEYELDIKKDITHNISLTLRNDCNQYITLTGSGDSAEITIQFSDKKGKIKLDCFQEDLFVTALEILHRKWLDRDESFELYKISKEKL